MRKRTREPWRSAAEHGRTLGGLSLNLIVRDIAKSLPFYTEALGFTALYSDEDYAALARDGVSIQLHADHAYEHMPWGPELARGTRRGLGAEIRILGIDPQSVEGAAARTGSVVMTTAVRAHGWRDVIVADPDGYVFAVGTAT